MRLVPALLALVALVVVPVSAQDAPLGRAIPIEDPSGTVLPRVHRALRRAERREGVARLAFWGASHTASDQYAGFLRERLIRRFGDAGHGLVMPAMPFPLYARRDLAIEGPSVWTGLAVRGRDRQPDRYGRAGFALEARGETFARVRIVDRRVVRHVEAWALAQPGGGTVSIAADGSDLRSISSDGPLGSIFLEADVARARRVDVRVSNGPVRLFGLLLESGTPGVIVESFGVPGARARDQLPWDEATMREQIARRPPDLVALAYGTNETGDRTPMADLDRDLRAVIARWRAIAPEAAILLIGPSDWPRLHAGTYSVRPRTIEVRDLYRRIAIDRHCGFFDLVAFQGGANSIPRWVSAGLALGDHVHMTDEGHERLATVLERALLAGYE